jgi:hypothetical protein
MMLPVASLIDTSDSKSTRVRIWLAIALIVGILIQFPNLFIYDRLYTTPLRDSGRLLWEEIYYVPNCSPIIRNWILLRDGLMNVITGEPQFFYPIRVIRGNIDVLEPFYAPDFADVWDSWINIVRRAGYMDVLAVKAAVFTVIGLLVCVAIVAGYGIRRNLRTAAPEE